MNNTLNIKIDNLQIPKLAYRYIPSKEDIIKIDNKNNKSSIRRIFSTLKPESFYLEHELKGLTAFNSLLKNNNSSENIFLYKEDILRFLQAVNYDCKKALELIIIHQNWRLQHLPINYNKTINDILNCGFIYVYGRDHYFRPIIVINVEIYLKKKDLYSYDNWSKSIIYLLEYIKDKLLIPGQIEQWVTIMNMSNCSFLTIPEELKTFTKLMQENYRCRLSMLFIIGLSFLMRWALKIMSNLLEGTTKEKLKILSNNSELLDYINKNQIEPDFNGEGIEILSSIESDDIINENNINKEKLRILKHGVFPPVFNNKDNDCGCTNIISKKNIVYEDTYKNLIKDNCIVNPDPSIILDEELD